MTTTTFLCSAKFGEEVESIFVRRPGPQSTQCHVLRSSLLNIYQDPLKARGNHDPIWCVGCWCVCEGLLIFMYINIYR